ncbi:hypothetical protein D3C87_1585600 [compost metagenome]
MRRLRISGGNNRESLRENVVCDVRPAQIVWNGEGEKAGTGNPRVDLCGTFHRAFFGNRPGNGQYIPIRAETRGHETNSFAERRDRSHAQLPQRMTQ